MKSIGEFYFTKINPGVHMTIDINQFYFKNFMCLYDNIKDYSMELDDYVSKSMFQQLTSFKHLVMFTMVLRQQLY